ncbi:hypothetical protein RQP46_008126 [Phenoliferia psychrophenolica]
MSTRATVHSLASELLFAVFELAHDPHKPSTMCSAALVCRAWRHPAQRALFQDVVVPVCYSNGHDPDEAPVQLNSREELVRRWEDYASSRLYHPLWIHLEGPAVGEQLPDDFDYDEDDFPPEACVGIGSPELRWCAGVKNLTIRNVEVRCDFLSDPNLGVLETLTLDFRRTWPTDPFDERPRVPWPTSLRKLTDVGQGDVMFLLGGLEARRGLKHVDIYLNHHLQLHRTLETVPALRPFMWGLVDCSITVRTNWYTCPSLQPLFDILPLLSHFKIRIHKSSLPNSNADYLHSLVGTLPNSIKRLTIERAHAWFRLDAESLVYIPFEDIGLIIENLDQLVRIDFPDVKRGDLEEYAGAADVLAECERRAIRVVCWEEFL